ncbi:hypothetical protein [Planctomyces sp. SH-PL62]|uniref:hypothetical protein n=1 Tax=Planctomyces sp. SH-PL62 TaxID=1636152 RepID=UPI00078BDEAA|nr:hypothetical protein [Planctomyces sp. SH-PL62]AMV38095.1 hypothetical protein VT85_11700 [Planctomyces sp. SH-PL62]
MAADPNILEIPPGEYSIPGVDRVLVVQGAAFWRLPSQPTNLADLAVIRHPADSPSPRTPAERPASTAPPSIAFYVLMTLAGAGLGAWTLPKLAAWISPNAPQPIAPVDPRPEPTPDRPQPQPQPRPDWLPQLEALGSRLDQLERSGAGPPPPPISRASPQAAPR